MVKSKTRSKKKRSKSRSKQELRLFTPPPGHRDTCRPRISSGSGGGVAGGAGGAGDCEIRWRRGLGAGGAGGCRAGGGRAERAGGAGARAAVAGAETGRCSGGSRRANPALLSPTRQQRAVLPGRRSAAQRAGTVAHRLHHRARDLACAPPLRAPPARGAPGRRGGVANRCCTRGGRSYVAMWFPPVEGGGPGRRRGLTEKATSTQGTVAA